MKHLLRQLGELCLLVLAVALFTVMLILIQVGAVAAECITIVHQPENGTVGTVEAKAIAREGVAGLHMTICKFITVSDRCQGTEDLRGTKRRVSCLVREANRLRLKGRVHFLTPPARGFSHGAWVQEPDFGRQGRIYFSTAQMHWCDVPKASYRFNNVLMFWAGELL